MHTAALFIAKRASLSLLIVRKFLEAHFEYETQLGLCLPCRSDDGQEKVADVYCERREISTKALISESDAIAERTGLNRLTVAYMLAHEVGYLASLSLVKEDAYLFAPAWADSSPWPDLWIQYGEAYFGLNLP